MYNVELDVFHIHLLFLQSYHKLFFFLVLWMAVHSQLPWLHYRFISSSRRYIVGTYFSFFFFSHVFNINNIHIEHLLERHFTLIFHLHLFHLLLNFTYRIRCSIPICLHFIEIVFYTCSFMYFFFSILYWMYVVRGDNQYNRRIFFYIYTALCWIFFLFVIFYVRVLCASVRNIWQRKISEKILGISNVFENTINVGLQKKKNIE